MKPITGKGDEQFLPPDTEPMELMTTQDWADWGKASIVAVIVVLLLMSAVWVIATAQTGRPVWPW
jgi:hypothetical protein